MYYDLGNLKIFVEDSYEEMSKKGAEVIAAQVVEKTDSVIGLATGSTPVGMYKELARKHKEETLDFSCTTTFNLDEYYPIKRANDQSYYYFMYDNLFNHINVPSDKINLPNGEAADIEEECASYEKKIKAAGGIDLQLLGIGNNGHIGFNEPDGFFEKDTHVVNLQQNTIEANSRFFDSVDDVPKQAVTMGIKTIMSAKKILMLVNGEKKADIVKAFFPLSAVSLI